MYIEGTYNASIVVLSIIIAIVASYFSFNIAERIPKARGKKKYFWLIAGAFVMGNGIWSFHFFGMLAFSLGIKVSYNISLTLLSVVVSTIAAFGAFFITIFQDRRKYKVVLGGIVMASGIILMHYIGMAAMNVPAELSYDPFWFFLSLIIAFVASYSALFLFLYFSVGHSTRKNIKWLSAIIMGLAISGMHYGCMKATKFYLLEEQLEYHDEIDLFLLSGVTITVVIILFVFWGILLFDRFVLTKMAYTDPLTGLSNRNAMTTFFDEYIESESVGILFLDLDQFKLINDTLGHRVGDLLLKQVAGRLREIAIEDQKIFRIGGDEFLIIVRRSKLEQLESLAIQVLNQMKKTFYVEENELYVKGSIGISLGEIRNSGIAELFQMADIAMYTAKEKGEGKYSIYNEEMGEEEFRRSKLVTDIQTAALSNELYLVYQPKWHVFQNRLYGFEALLRWKHPKLGLVSPGEFIPITEEAGTIIPITRWVLEQACCQAKKWSDQGMNETVSVNLSARVFQTENLQEWVHEVLEKTQLDPSLLELEITESVMLHDIDKVNEQLQAIRAYGVRVSMDDFGVGYSSIGLLDRISLDVLKLDRLFVNDLEKPSKRAIINAIMVMAEALKLDVIAEGVENKKQIESLTELGCHIMQGYYYSRPMKVDEVNEWVKKHTTYYVNY